MSSLRDLIEWKSQIAATISHERRFALVLRKLFKRQEKEVLGKVKKASLLNLTTVTKVKDQFDLYLDNLSLDESKWNKEFAKLTIPLYKNMVKVSGSKVFSDLNIGIAFNLDAPEVRNFIKNKAIKFSGFVNGETNAGLNRIIKPIIRRGGTIEEVRERIQNGVRRRFNSSVRGTASRARLISRTEMVGASNGGALEAAKQTKVVKLLKAWLTSKDKKVRGTHKSAGIRYSRIKGIALNKNFKVGSALLSAPGIAVGGSNKVAEVVNCLINGRALIYTSKGWVKIEDIKKGDLVLSHKGKFRKVISTISDVMSIKERSYKGDVVRLSIRRSENTKKGFNYLTVTPEHKLLINGKWVQAKYVKVKDNISVLLKECIECKKYFYSETPNYKFCSKSCSSKAIAKGQWARKSHRENISKKASLQMEREYTSGARDKFAITKKANEKCRELVQNGQMVFQKFTCKQRRKYLDSRNVQMSGNVSKCKGMISKVEDFFADLLKESDTVFKRQVYIGKFFVDFLLSNNLIIECDGNYHRKPSQVVIDKKRDNFLSSRGYIVLRFFDKDIFTKGQECVNEVKRVLRNHSNNYKFGSMEIMKVDSWKLKRTRRLYNFSVEKDESYIADTFVSRNCRCVLIFTRKGK